jgi:hypothetical protein
MIISSMQISGGWLPLIRAALHASCRLRRWTDLFRSLRRSITSANPNVAFYSRDLVFVFNASVSRIPPESNCMRDRINPLFRPPPFLVSDAV